MSVSTNEKEQAILKALSGEDRGIDISSLSDRVRKNSPLLLPTSQPASSQVEALVRSLIHKGLIESIGERSRYRLSDQGRTHVAPLLQKNIEHDEVMKRP